MSLGAVLIDSLVSALLATFAAHWRDIGPTAVIWLWLILFGLTTY